MNNMLKRAKSVAEKWSKKQQDLKSSATRYDAFLEGVGWSTDYLSGYKLSKDKKFDEYVIIKAPDKTYQAFKKSTKGPNPNDLYNAIETVELNALASANAKIAILEEELKSVLESISGETVRMKAEILEAKELIKKLSGKV